MITNLIPFPTYYASKASKGFNTHSLDLITEEQVRRVFFPLGAQEYEIPEITVDLSNALDSLDKDYVQQNPDIVDTLLDKISELSDTRERFHVPYELLVDALQDDPEFVKRVCNMSEVDSPREVLNEILSSSPLNEDEDDEDGLPSLAIAIWFLIWFSLIPQNMFLRYFFYSNFMI